MTETEGTGGYPEMQRRGTMLRLLRRTASEAHERGELAAQLSFEGVGGMAGQVGCNPAQAVALFHRLQREGRWEGKLMAGYKGVPFSIAMIEDLTSEGMREVGELPDPAEDLARRLAEAARALEKRDDVPDEQKTVGRRALDELAHFVRGLPPGAAVEFGSRLAGG